MKASFRLISADTLIKQTHLGHAGKNSLSTSFMSSLKPQLHVFRSNIPDMQGSLNTDSDLHWQGARLYGRPDTHLNPGLDTALI